MDPAVVHERTHDVVICGGGLAGLTLALQLKRALPGLDVLVLERRAHPVPHAAHKVGESSVEVGAHYFDTVLGLKAHMDEAQLRKFGFRFFFTEGRRDIENVTELGASRMLAIPSYQIDRGIFENFLARHAAECGVRFEDQAMVRSLDVADAGGEEARDALHRVAWTRNGAAHAARCTWLIDASGRAGLLKRKLGLARSNAHQVNAAWFRVKDRIVLDDWSEDPAWRARCTPAARWLSTNHLCGAGYWVWLIPLASGSHSVGIVADPALHPLENFDSFDKAMDWLREWQPLVHDALQGGQVQDFMFLRKFSHGCEQVFDGARRWAMTGESGLFLDPFYSPGSDFIAIANTYICDLVLRQAAGREVARRARLYDQIYHSFYDSTLALYQDQYPIFGDPQVLPVKVIWDYAYYWGVLSQIFFNQRLTDLDALAGLRTELRHCQQLNLAVQALLREWSRDNAAVDSGGMLDQAALPWFADLNASLARPCADAAAFAQRVRGCVGMLRTLAWQIGQARLTTQGVPADAALQALLDQELPGCKVDRTRGPMLFAASMHAASPHPAARRAAA